MHPSLLVQDTPELRSVLLVQSFKKRVPAIIQSDALQQGIGDAGLLLTLQGNGRQLLVVADEHKLSDGIAAVVAGR